MAEYVFFVDSGCDLSQETFDAWGIRCMSMTYLFEGENQVYRCDEADAHEFYEKMRAGKVAKTSGVNQHLFETAFEETLKDGKDVFYIGFSSALSMTFHMASVAAEELADKYPERKIRLVDSLSASGGYALLVRLAHEKAEAGATVEELADYAESIKLSLCHWFTVDDLGTLKRGGRVSPTVALVGGLLGIKPVLHTDDQGRLTFVDKVRGRKAALKAICDKYGETCTDRSAPVFLSHGDCAEDAKAVEEMLKERFGVTVEKTTVIGPTIGAHSGPGTVALFFTGSNR